MTSSTDDDVITKFFRRGLLDILERIFLELDPDSKVACSRVSLTWKNIVDFFFNSSNPRYQVTADFLERISIWGLHQ